MSFGSGFFAVFGIMSVLIPIIVTAIFVVVFVKILSTHSKNKNSPKLTVDAEVVAKRERLSRNMHHSESHFDTMSTWYYITFQVESGDRMELSVSEYDYGMIIEGDRGKLTFQGTNFISFERTY